MANKIIPSRFIIAFLQIVPRDKIQFNMASYTERASRDWRLRCLDVYFIYRKTFAPKRIILIQGNNQATRIAPAQHRRAKTKEQFSPVGGGLIRRRPRPEDVRAMAVGCKRPCQLNWSHGGVGERFNPAVLKCARSFRSVENTAR